MRKIIGDNVKSIRKKQHLSQQKLADKCFVEQKFISNVENYRENFGIDKLKMLSHGLKICPYELMISEDEITVRALLEKESFVKGVIVMLHQYYLLLHREINREVSSHPIEIYGIGLKDQALPCIKDISTDQAFVKSLVELCNANQVDPMHLINVVEDAIFEKEQ